MRVGLDMSGRVGMPVPGGAPASLVRVDEGTRANSDSWNLGGTARLERRWGRGQESWLTWTGIRGAYGMPPDLRTLNPRFWRWTDWSVDMGVLGHSSRWTERFRTKVWLFGLFPRNTLKAYDDAGYDSQDSAGSFTSTFQESRIGVRGLLALDWVAPSQALPQRLEAKWSMRRDSHTDRSSQPEDSIGLSEYRLEAGVGLKSGQWHGWSWGTALHGFVVLPDDVPGASSQASPAFTPGVWAMWEGETLRTKVAASRRVRFPTLKERYSGMAEYLVANPNLGPESAWNAELDVNWQVASWATLSADLFGSLVDGLIADEAVGGGALKLGNIDEATLAGATLALQVTPVSMLTLWAKAAALYARGSREPAYLPYRPLFRGQVAAQLSPLESLSLGARLRIEGPQHYQDRYTTRWGELGAYALLDVWANYRIGQWQLWANAQNVTDAWHEPHWGYPGPGLWATVGAQWEWE